MPSRDERRQGVFDLAAGGEKGSRTESLSGSPGGAFHRRGTERAGSIPAPPTLMFAILGKCDGGKKKRGELVGYITPLKRDNVNARPAKGCRITEGAHSRHHNARQFAGLFALGLRTRVAHPWSTKPRRRD